MSNITQTIAFKHPLDHFSPFFEIFIVLSLN